MCRMEPREGIEGIARVRDACQQCRFSRSMRFHISRRTAWELNVGISQEAMQVPLQVVTAKTFKYGWTALHYAAHNGHAAWPDAEG